ncbi:DUF4198 domain-containing protein [Planctomicrobium sp. SH668]|uniref:DUF4198 domain-containing protein n=1 Tax=Planctomicrobium sp. SH668 TaxID=3448126 RepID=UPI003F5B8A23
MPSPYVRPRMAILVLSLIFMAAPLLAHDTWVETNASVIRAGDAVFIDLKLGNHGNDHRDFKLASKLNLDGATFQVHLPNGAQFNLIDQVRDLGYAPNEGYWSSRFVTGAAGTYVVSHQMDKVVSHGRPVRSVRSAKCFFLASALLDRLQDETNLWKEPLGHPLEIVPVSHPVLLTGPGVPIEVKVLRNGTPAVDARVAFIPQGVTLSEGFDETYERKTNAEGIASFTPRVGNRYLIVTHERRDDETSDNYDATLYAATLEILIPDICPCCQ